MPSQKDMIDFVDVVPTEQFQDIKSDNDKKLEARAKELEDRFKDELAKRFEPDETVEDGD